QSRPGHHPEPAGHSIAAADHQRQQPVVHPGQPGIGPEHTTDRHRLRRPAQKAAAVNITEITPDSGSAQSAVQTWRINQPNSAEGRRYRSLFTISLPTGGFAEDLRFLEQCKLSARASHDEFNALDGSAPEKAQLHKI